MFTFINNKIEYTCHDVVRTYAHGLSLLLETKAGNWIVANGANIQTEKFVAQTTGYVTGDWNHGHYFMGDKWGAKNYFEALKEKAV